MIRLPGADDRAMWDLWLSSLHLPTILAADECGVFDALAKAPAAPADLAHGLGLNPRTLEQIAPLLAALDLVTIREGRLYLTPLARAYLVKGRFYWGGILAYERMGSVIAPQIVEKLRGPDARPKAGGAEEAPVEGWEQASLPLEIAQGVAAFMESQSTASAYGAAAALDLSDVASLLDVGGGSACFSIAFAEANPSLRCTVMELDTMCAVASAYIGRSAAADRVGTLTLDMFRNDWPAGHDAIFLSNVFHDWAEDTNRNLAARAFKALPKGGRIVLHEQLLDDDKSGPLTVAAFSILMLLGARGRQYNFGELRGFLESAGFTDIGVTPTYGYYSAVTGWKK